MVAKNIKPCCVSRVILREGQMVRRKSERNCYSWGMAFTLMLFLLFSCGAVGENALTETTTTTTMTTTETIEGNAYFVAPEGSDSNDGSIDSPWATISYAVKKTGAGDTVYLREGTYTEEVVLRGDWGAGGKNGQFWTLEAYPGETAVIKGNKMKLYMVGYVRIKGLRFENSGISINSWTKAGWTVPHNIEVLNNTFETPQLRYSIITVHGNDNLVEGNVLKITGGGDSLDHGIYVQSGSRNIIRNNYISGASGWGIHVYDELKDGRTGQMTDVIIEGNTVIGGNKRGAIIVATGSGETLARGIIIRNNILYSNGANEIEVRSKSKDIYIYNNTLYRGGEGGDGIRIAVCCGTSGSINGVTIKNNLIDIGGSGGYHVNVGTSAAELSGLILENNLYWPGPPELKSIEDSRPVVGDPKFVSPGTADLHLRSGSAAIDSGLTLREVTTDKDGTSRPQGSAYDIGAYEYH